MFFYTTSRDITVAPETGFPKHTFMNYFAPLLLASGFAALVKRSARVISQCTFTSSPLQAHVIIHHLQYVFGHHSPSLLTYPASSRIRSMRFLDVLVALEDSTTLFLARRTSPPPPRTVLTLSGAPASMDAFRSDSYEDLVVVGCERKL